MDLALTLHAQKRMQQRGIPPFVIELLEQFGSSARCPGGAERLTFDKPARARLSHAFGGARGVAMIDRWLRVYMVISDDTGEVVTAAHRSHRFRNKHKRNQPDMRRVVHQQ